MPLIENVKKCEVLYVKLILERKKKSDENTCLLIQRGVVKGLRCQ